MSTLNLEDKVKFLDFKIEDDFLVIRTTEDKVIKKHKKDIPFLEKVSKKNLSEFEILGDGEGVHWPLLDVDLSAAYLIFQEKFQRKKEGKKAA